jgi:hypothetical protein
MAFALPSAAPESAISRRIKAMVIGAAAVIALAIAGFSHQWFVLHVEQHEDTVWVKERHADMSFGLVSCQQCFIQCERAWNKEIIDMMKDTGASEVHASLAFPAFGILTLGTLVFGIAGLVIALVLAALGVRMKRPVAPTTVAQIALGLSITEALAMTWTRPSVAGLLSFDIGQAWWIFLCGAVVGIVAARMLGRHLAGDVSDVEIPPAQVVS